MNIKPSFYAQALYNLCPGAKWHLYGEEIVYEAEVVDGVLTGNQIASNLEWLDLNTQEVPSKQEILDEVTRLDALWESLEYQRQRQPEYPPLADLADALYWQAQGDETKMTAYLAAVEAVKQKYPKGV